MENPVVSIIVPIFQVEDYLKRCLDSIRAQTYRDLEILLIDDGSRDNCGKICDEYAKKDSRTVVIHQENKGLSAARNKGIEISSGDYLTFVDPDDILLYDRYIELLLDALIKDKAQISMCGQITFGDGAQPEYGVEYEKSRIISGRDILSQRTGVYGSCGWNVLAKLFDRRVFSDIRFPEGHLLEDTAILHRILLPVKKVSLLGFRMYGKYLRQDGILGTIDPLKMFQESMFAFNDRISYYRERDESELEKQAIIEKTRSKAIFYLRCQESDYLDDPKGIQTDDLPSTKDLHNLFEYYYPAQKRDGARPEKKKIFLHIGQPKTGTTAIQAFLAKNRKLLEDQGICFYRPAEYSVDQFQNSNFVMGSASIDSGSTASELIDSKLRLEKWLFGEYTKPYDTLLMSNELDWICACNIEDYWARVRSYYESIMGTDIDFRIIVNLRRQDDWTYSYWKESIRTSSWPESRDFRTYLEKMHGIRALDYKYGLQLIEETFGKDSISVIPYENETDVNSIIDEICNIAGISRYETFILPTSRINTSISGSLALAMLLINRGEVECHVDKRKLIKAAGLLSDLYPETEQHYPLPREERTQLLDRYRDDNRAVAMEYLGCDELFDYEIGDYRELTSDSEIDRQNAKKLIEFATILPAQDGFKNNDK